MVTFKCDRCGYTLEIRTYHPTSEVSDYESAMNHCNSLFRKAKVMGNHWLLCKSCYADLCE